MRLLALLLALLLASTLTGCTVLDYATGAVSSYCALPETARSANREAVAMAVAPNRITIACARDQ